MPVSTKGNQQTNEPKPWERLGMSYQKYNYQRKKGLLVDSDPSGQTIIAPNQQVSQDTILRHSILIDEFLEQCESNTSALRNGLFITQQMTNAIYQTLRQDGH